MRKRLKNGREGALTSKNCSLLGRQRCKKGSVEVGPFQLVRNLDLQELPDEFNPGPDSPGFGTTEVDSAKLPTQRLKVGQQHPSIVVGGDDVHLGDIVGQTE